ncbi:MAG TPA: hypothetical protein VKD72_02505, partial [Gemmataceae bacterium]|nr:hypothetical protein [Gemmataceae bacterium]
RRKLLQAALSYYKDFLDQLHDNDLTREELLQGHARVATLLEAIGQRSDAQAVWNRASRMALTFGDGQGAFHLIPVNSRLRLLRLSPVQEELKLSEQQVRSVLELESQRNERDRQGSQGENLERQAVALLSPPQVRRLNQIFLQQRGLWAFEDTRVSAALALTPAQREALTTIQKEAQTASRVPGPVENRGEKPPMERALRHLTPEQKARWRELVGEPFRAALPPGDVVLCVGKLVLTMTPVGAGK